MVKHGYLEVAYSFFHVTFMILLKMSGQATVIIFLSAVRFVLRPTPLHINCASYIILGIVAWTQNVIDLVWCGTFSSLLELPYLAISPAGYTSDLL